MDAIKNKIKNNEISLFTITPLTYRDDIKITKNVFDKNFYTKTDSSGISSFNLIPLKNMWKRYIEYVYKYIFYIEIFLIKLNF
jgi:hypothetical protein